MKKDTVRTLIYSLVGAALVTAIAGWGVLRRPDKWMQDVLCQTPSVSSGDIVVIGIDDRALSEIGPYNTWDRNVMASALEYLAADPDKRPAVVAIDTIYSSKTDPEADRRLADAARELGNVVVATAGSFGTRQTFENGETSIDNYAVLSYDMPYEALREATTQGHINAMYDRDGIMRHALLYIEPQPGVCVYSMAYQTAKIYMNGLGEEPELPPVNSRGQFYVHFSAGPGAYYDGKSIADLVSGTLSPDYFAGKIVLIGPYAAGLQDSYATPVDRSEQMYGVEFQANVIQSIIEGRYNRECADWPQLIVMFLVCFTASYLFFDRKVLSSFIICVILMGLSIGATVLIYENGLVTHPLWIPFGVLTLFIISVVTHYLKAAQERMQVTRTFERYVAPEIVREIMKEGTENLSLGGKTCEIAVLFVDIRGFTTMSERMSPEEVVFILNRYLTMTSGCVEKNSGTLDKFVGDATMAFWGAPLPQEDAVLLACRTALDIVDGAAELSRQLKEEIGEELKVGVGVHYGPAVVGNMGSEKHMDYTAIGDTVNTSARLEANAPGGTVYISRRVADELGDLAKVESLGDTIKLKGKAEGFEVLKLLSLKGREDA